MFLKILKIAFVFQMTKTYMVIKSVFQMTKTCMVIKRGNNVSLVPTSPFTTIYVAVCAKN